MLVLELINTYDWSVERIAKLLRITKSSVKQDKVMAVKPQEKQVPLNKRITIQQVISQLNRKMINDAIE